MRILITGGRGMIGQAIARKHAAMGDEVLIYDTEVNPHIDYQRAPYVGKLIRNLRDVGQVDLVSIHGAVVSVRDSMVKPWMFTTNNVGHVAEVIQELPWLKAKRIIYAGSMGPYGEGKYLCPACDLELHPPTRTTFDYVCPNCCTDLMQPVPMRENIPLYPRSHYAVSKLAGEQMLRVLVSNDSTIRVVSLRYFSVYGPQSPPHNPSTGVLSVIGGMILDPQRETIELHEDGCQTRDLVHEDDCADAHFHFTRNWPSNSFEAVNIGTGRSMPVGEIALAMVSQIACRKPVVFNCKIRPGDVRHATANVTHATLLGWRAERAIGDGIRQYCEWLKIL